MRARAFFLPALLLCLGGCAAPTTGAGGGGGGGAGGADGKADSSAVAVFLNMEMDGEVWTRSSWNPRGDIDQQLFYTVGQLNGESSISRLDRVVVSDVATEDVDGWTRITYHARIPVAWGRRDDVPEQYDFVLPRDVSRTGLDTFTEKYGHDCVDWGAHDVDSGILWYYYRPDQSRCRLDDGDVVRLSATVTPSDIQTTGKFPEYHRVWEDDELRVLAVFGKYDDGATTSSDAGIGAYNRFVRELRSRLSAHDLVTVPEEIPNEPGVDVDDVLFEATLDDGKKVTVNALLVDNVRTASSTFDARYAELSTRADLIIYSGHSGLGANIRALASKGRWVAGQYAIVFMNGCDTYAYVDSALADAHAAVNPDDPDGTKYLDIITNAMPSFFSSMPRAALALVDGLMDTEAPRTYERIFQDIDRSQVVLVSGEQDNEYVPGMDGGGGEPPPDAWEGLSEGGTVARGEEKRFETPQLAAGTYVFEMRGTGDADLYVRVGTAPTTEVYDCRPYDPDSDETCEVEITTPAAVHVMVRGYASSSDWELTGRPR